MGLRPLILETHLNFFWESGLGTTWLASTNRFAAYGKEQIAIPSFAIGDERQITGLGDDLGQSLGTGSVGCDDRRKSLVSSYRLLPRRRKMSLQTNKRRF